MEHRFISLIILAALLLTSALEPLVWAGVATEQMRDTVDRVVAVIQDSRLKAAGGQAERRERLRQAIGARFDFNEMAKRSLGPNWQRRTPEEQREFASLFAALLEKAYADQIEALHGDKIVFGRELLGQNHAEVDSKIFTAKREEFSVNYKLLATDGEWKVYDVVASDVSLINNYRSQFNLILAKGSFAELLRAMGDGPDDVSVK
ncbi:MAG: ABC transporter substrate-binding protein [Candidatus Binatia bacterium]